MNTIRIITLTVLVLLFCALPVTPVEAQDYLTLTVTPEVPETPIALPEGLVFGVYDTVGNLTHPDIRIEQEFVAWNAGPDAVVTAINGILSRGRFPMIALEPYSQNGWNGLTDETLLEDIASGWYDDVIRADCSALAAYAPQEIWVRWGHEMELDGMFPWSQGDPAAFISAYRYFVIACRDVIGASNVRFLWSPAGNGNLVDYYPGDEYVDYISLTALGYEDWDLQYGPTWRSFNELFWSRYDLVRGYGKSVVIAELGVCCGLDHQYRWLLDGYHAMLSTEWYPLLRAAVYFNDVNSSSDWSLGLTPDWRICSALYPASNVLGRPADFSGCENEFTPLSPPTADE